MKRALYLLLTGLILPLTFLVVSVGVGLSGRLPGSDRSPTALPTPVSPVLSPVLTPSPESRPSAGSPVVTPASGDPFAVDPSLERRPDLICSRREPLLLLLVGADSREDSYAYGLADVIRLVRVDFEAPQLSVLAIPRDLWVAIPAISDHYGITHGKINQAYLYGGEGMGYYDAPGGGPGLLALTLAENYGVGVDRYLAVNMATFVEVVDALGGIDIVLPEAVDGRPARGGSEDQFFPEGEQHLDGAAALRLARLRANYDDLARIEHQDLVLEALRAKLFSPAILPTLPKLVEAFAGSLLTDLRLGEIAGLLCLAPQIDADSLIFARIPPALLELGREESPQLNGRVSVLRADPEALAALLADFQAGIWP